MFDKVLKTPLIHTMTAVMIQVSSIVNEVIRVILSLFYEKISQAKKKNKKRKMNKKHKKNKKQKKKYKA